MIQLINLNNQTTATKVLNLQKMAYAHESKLVGFEVPTMRETIEDLQACNYTYYAFIFEAEIIGVCALEMLPTAPTILTIAKLFVSPQYFRKGIGKTLLFYVASFALLKGFKKISVSTASLNAPAIRLYNRLGYELVSVEEVAPKVSLSFFEKDIS